MQIYGKGGDLIPAVPAVGFRGRSSQCFGWGGSSPALRGCRKIAGCEFVGINSHFRLNILCWNQNCVMVISVHRHLQISCH